MKNFRFGKLPSNKPEKSLLKREQQRQARKENRGGTPARNTSKNTPTTPTTQTKSDEKLILEFLRAETDLMGRVFEKAYYDEDMIGSSHYPGAWLRSPTPRPLGMNHDTGRWEPQPNCAFATDEQLLPFLPHNARAIYMQMRADGFDKSAAFIGALTMAIQIEEAFAKTDKPVMNYDTGKCEPLPCFGKASDDEILAFVPPAVRMLYKEHRANDKKQKEAFLAALYTALNIAKAFEPSE